MIKCDYKAGLQFLTWNVNFQGILNWIIKILHYYCRKQQKNSKNSQIIEQNVVISLPLSLLSHTVLTLPSPSSMESFFSFWTQYSANFKHHKSLFMLYIVLFSGLKMAFSTLHLTKDHCLHQKTVFTVTSIYFISWSSITIERLYRFFSFINSSAQIFLKLN